MLKHHFPFALFCFALLAAIPSVCFAQQAAETNSTADTLPAGQTEVRAYDLTEAIDAYVEESDLPDEEARQEAIDLLFAPCATNCFPVRREEFAPGRFTVWAPKNFHDWLPSVGEWMKNDCKQICIEARFVTVTEETRNTLHEKFSDRWQISVCNRSETTKVQPTVTTESAVQEVVLKETDQVISSSFHTIKPLPSRVAQLTAEQASSVVQQHQTDRTQVLQAPKITVFPNQQAVIKDAGQRPFVTSVIPIVGDSAVAVQPVITVLEEGLEVQLEASFQDDGQLDLESVVTLTEITDVDTFSFQLGEAAQQTTVQVPEQQVGQVRVSTTVDDGSSLLIDPNFVKQTTTKQRWGRTIESRTYTMVLLTPTIIQERPVPSVSQSVAAFSFHLSYSR